MLKKIGFVVAFLGIEFLKLAWALVLVWALTSALKFFVRKSKVKNIRKPASVLPALRRSHKKKGVRYVL